MTTIVITPGKVCADTKLTAFDENNNIVKTFLTTKIFKKNHFVVGGAGTWPAVTAFNKAIHRTLLSILGFSITFDRSFNFMQVTGCATTFKFYGDHAIVYNIKYRQLFLFFTVLRVVKITSYKFLGGNAYIALGSGNEYASEYLESNPNDPVGAIKYASTQDESTNDTIIMLESPVSSNHTFNILNYFSNILKR